MICRTYLGIIRYLLEFNCWIPEHHDRNTVGIGSKCYFFEWSRSTFISTMPAAHPIKVYCLVFLLLIEKEKRWNNHPFQCSRISDIRCCCRRSAGQYWDAIWGWEYMVDAKDNGHIIWCWFTGNKWTHKKIYADSELEETSTIRNFRIVQTEGSRQVTRNTKHYNLQMIIAVGFKVNNERADPFYSWCE